MASGCDPVKGGSPTRHSKSTEPSAKTSPDRENATLCRASACFSMRARTAPLAASFEAGEPRTVDYVPSFVDGIGSKTVFPNMFEHARKLLDGSLIVTLHDAVQAMKLVAERNRIIVEGASACAVAGARSGRAGSGKIVAIVSGGNIDLDKFTQLVSDADRS